MPEDREIRRIAWQTAVEVFDTLPARRQAGVTMKRTDPTADDVAWEAYAADGTAIDISASTSDGFAEAHTSAQTNRRNMIVEGGGINNTYPNANVIGFTGGTRQTLGPADSQTLDFRNVNLTFTGLTSGTALTVDSFSKGLLRCDGQIVCNHNGVALEFRPSTNYDGDANKNQGVAELFFRVVQNTSTDANAVVTKFNAQTGESLNGSKYGFLEINGGKIGAQFTTAGTGVIIGCHFYLWGLHNYLDAAGGIGLDVQAGVKACKFEVETSTPANADYTAKINSIASRYDIFDLTSGETKILLDTAAEKNIVYVWAPDASGITFTDNSGVATNSVYFNNALQ